ncbi:FAD-dependent oxidoreductase [Aeromicrobium yanjiei]|uniref:FAD-binding protein n=1 Tax=Aeromicrobium yanjiei TaxID=2662028 RepID=A0A5Q2MLS4_9ACTN|nr:FAD-binding protein [Aeromicrobium yanjiei]QGG40930.1 FAD-binding protein [Aeromicrobium yanjiei]
MNADGGPDLVVAGAGGGLAAAVRAASLGLDVLVVDSNEHFAVGNNTAMSTAMIPGAGSRWQRESGVEDSAEIFVGDIMAKTHDEADPALAATLAGVSAELVEWLADDVGMPLSLVTDFDYPGHSRRRCHTVPGRSGRAMLAHLVREARRHPRIDLLVPAHLDDVLMGGTGVRAVVVSTPSGTEEIPTDAVLLATNGFAANRDLVAQHAPEIAEAVYHGSEASTGDALAIGARLGGATAYLDAYQGHAALAMPAATLAGWATVMHGAFLVDRHGRRFGDETTGYSEYAAEVLRHADGQAWIILDSRIDEACSVFQDYLDTRDSGAVKWAGTARELAAETGIDPEGLERTLRQTQLFARGEQDDELGRTFWEQELGGRLAAVAVRPALFHTQGGLRVDEHARVVDEAGSPIVGLYASGGAAMGISGHGAGGYLAGNGLLPALGLAYLAADHVAAGHS